MKSVVFLAIFNFSILNCEKFNAVIESAFDGILTTGLANHREFTIINYDSDGNLNDFVLQAKTVGIHSYKVKNLLGRNHSENFEVETSAIIGCNSVQSLINFNKLVKLTNIFFQPFKFYIHFESASMNELSALMRLDTMKKNRPLNEYDKYMTDILQFQYFIVEENDAIKLMTFVWFTDEKCNEAQLTEVNSFDKVSRTWKNDFFAVEKFKDFKGCSVTLGAFWDYPALSFLATENGYLYFGQNAKMMVGLANALNFSLNINPFHRRYGENIPVDYLVHLQSMNNFEAFRGNSFFTTPYAYLNDYVAVPVGEDLNGYEKLLLPFDFETWMCILATFVAAFSIAFVVAFSSTKIRNFVFGKNITTPKMNIVAIFFGISQITMPGKNFSRFLNMLFILYCLIIRTAYQGKMFEFLQQNITKDSIQSIEEIIDKNITLYVEPRGIDFLRACDDLKGFLFIFI